MGFLVKTVNYRWTTRPALALIVLFWMVLGVPGAPGLWDVRAAENGATDGKVSKIHIVTDQAVMDSRARSAEFTGHVTLTMDDKAISADWIKIVYKAGIKNPALVKMDQKSIDTITAKGQVTIKMAELEAETPEAVFKADDNTLVLTGEKTRIFSGGDFIASDRITINLEDQSFRAESGGGGPVEALFHTKPGSLNLKKKAGP